MNNINDFVKKYIDNKIIDIPKHIEILKYLKTSSELLNLDGKDEKYIKDSSRIEKEYTSIIPELKYIYFSHVWKEIDYHKYDSVSYDIFIHLDHGSISITVDAKNHIYNHEKMIIQINNKIHELENELKEITNDNIQMCIYGDIEDLIDTVNAISKLNEDKLYILDNLPQNLSYKIKQQYKNI